MKSLSPATVLIVGAAAVVIGLIGFAVYRGAAPSPYDGFAQCLTEKGVKMYGAWWCPHCSNQKVAFGTAFKHVDYVECSPGNTRTMSEECRADGIQSFPTWVFTDGTKLAGERTLTELASESGCELPTVE
jgi:hypothetical protein